MPILKNNTQNNFVMVSKNITRDKNIGLTERGLLLTLMSLPDGWNLSIKGLAQILPDGKDKISKAMNNLIDCGYITREQERGFHGSFGANVLVIHETPINSTNPEGESSCNKSLSQAETPWTENPVTVNPESGKPSPENTSQYNTKDTKYIKEKNKEYKNKECGEDTLPDDQYESLVREFGKESVDYQISRIKNNHYKGCMNYQTISKWCEERKGREAAKVVSFKKNTVNHGFQGRNYTEEDFRRMEEELFFGKGVS